MEKRDWQQTPGDVGHVYFIRALAEAGRSDVLHRVYSRTGLGSYGGILAKGLTSLPETWDAMMDGRQSLNHCMLGHVMEWYYGHVGGIRQATNSVGWKEILIAPNPGLLTSADTAPVAAFTNKYNANLNINICAQCHNDRGAAWADTARAPHQSVQYNFLLGSVGQLLDGPATFNPGTHAGLPSSKIYSISGTFYLTNQCANCHMQSDSSDADNHTFAVTSDAVCYNCHLTPPEILEQYYLTPAISNSVTTLITGMNRWAARQTNALLTATNVVAWEYTSPGGLTWSNNPAGQVISWSLNNPVTFTGPSTAGQALIPDQIKRARFNMYLVLNDGSFGVHNPTLALNLLNAAQIWVSQVLR